MQKRSRKRRSWSFAEALETRALLATITVDSLADNTINDNQTTLREAIAQADGTAAQDDIVFASGLSGVITLNSPLDIGQTRLTITGNGRSNTIIDGNGGSFIFRDDTFGPLTELKSMTLRNADTAVFADVIDDQAGGGIFTIEDALITGTIDYGVRLEGRRYDNNFPGSGPNVTIRDSTITANTGEGLSFTLRQNVSVDNSTISNNGGTGIYSGFNGGYEFYAPVATISSSTISGNSDGGIVQNDGILTVEDSVVENNTSAAGAGIDARNASFSFVPNDQLIVRRSTISGNTATGDGGGIRSQVRTRIENSTISGNVGATGGGIRMTRDSSTSTGYTRLTLRNSTITANTSNQNGGGIYRQGVFTTDIQSTIIAGNTATGSGDDIGFDSIPNASTITFENNLLGTNANTPFTATGSTSPDANGNLIGSSASPINPQISSLVNMSGRPVHVPFMGSPVLDAGSNPENMNIDQLGGNRLIGSGVDIGAVESTGSSSNQISLNSGVLTITGTGIDDTIGIERIGSTLQVFINTTFVAYPNSQVQSVRVRGEAGDDSIIVKFASQPMILDGNSGDDTIKGGTGSDTILGGSGNDNLRGTKGNDLMNGGSGNDLIRGQLGNDTLHGGDGRDTLIGDGSNDTIYGDSGNDRIEGREGRDLIFGGIGHDRILGGDERDTINGEDGNDSITGEDGADSIIGAMGDDTIAGGDGYDTLLGGIGDDKLNGGNGQDVLRGSSGNDTLLGRNGSDVLIGDDGADFLDGFRGRDIVYGGTGADSMLGGGSDDLLIAGKLEPTLDHVLLDLTSGIRDEWLSGRSYDQRAINIRNGAGRSSNRLNSIYLLGPARNNANIFDDNAADTVTGGSGLDFFYATTVGFNLDFIDRTSDERLD